MNAGKDIAVRTAQDALSPVLEDAGVQLQVSDDGRYRAIMFPPGLRDKMNLLLPVEEVVQADPNYTPTVRAVRLDPSKDGPHFYDQQGRLAPRKQALEILADTAGIRTIKTRPMTRAELDSYPEGTLGYEATVVIRRSDGTPKEIVAHKVWDPTVERYRIEGEVEAAAQRGHWAQDRARAEVRKRLLAEKTHGPAKCESKALLRAIRSALQIPHTYTPQDAAKPFVVVGYSFTPDYEDPEVRRLLIEQGYAAAGAVYGGQQQLGAATAPTPSAEGSGAGAAAVRDPEPPPAQRGAKPVVSRPPGEAPAAQHAEGTSETPPTGTDAGDASAPAPFAGAEPGADPGAYVLPEEFTRYAGKALAEVPDSEYLAWLASEAVNEPTRSAARAYLTQQAQQGGAG